MWHRLTLPWFGGKTIEVKTRLRTHGLRWALMRRPWCYFLRLALIAFAARRVCLLTGFGARFHLPPSLSVCVSGDVRVDIGLLNDGRPIFTLPSFYSLRLVNLTVIVFSSSVHSASSPIKSKYLCASILKKYIGMSRVAIVM